MRSKLRPVSRLPLVLLLVSLLALPLLVGTAPGALAHPLAAAAGPAHPGATADPSASAHRGRLNPLGRARHSTSPHGQGHVAAPHVVTPQMVPPPEPLDLGDPLPLGSVPLGSYVTDQFERDGILFSGQQPFTTDDGSSATQPTLSGSPLFRGSIVGTLVRPGTTTPATRDAFSVTVGYIDNPNSVQMTVYDAKHKQLGVLSATQSGFNRLTSTFAGAASFVVSTVSNEDAGWEMQDIRVGPVSTAYVALGDSYSSGEGTKSFPWSTGQGTDCDTGPLAWPAQLAAQQTGAHNTLDIGPDSLVACQGETTSQLTKTVNKQQTSEIAQLQNQVTAASGTLALSTITIGGNDLGFSKVLGACYAGGVQACQLSINNLDKRLTSGSGSFIATLASSYQLVKQNAGDGTRVVVVGYPSLYPAPSGITGAFKVTHYCPYLRDTLSLPFGLVPSPFINQLLGSIRSAQSALNDDMAQAAAAAGVEFTPIPDSLDGHELCTGDSWINKISVLHAGYFGTDRNAGHPTVTGSTAIACTVASRIGTPCSSPAGAAGALAAPTSPPARAAAAAPVRAAAIAVTVSDGVLPPATTTIPYFANLVASGTTGAVTWATTGGTLTAGLTLDASGGTISGTPTEIGTSTFTVRATDSASPAASGTASVSITTTRPASLSVVSSPLPDGTIGQSYLGGLGANGGTGAVSWTVSRGSLPAGLRLDAVTGQLQGTPTGAGTSSFTVTAADSGAPTQTVSADRSITVEPSSAALSVTTSSLPSAAAGTTYAAQLTSTGGLAPIIWSVTAGGLPPGLALTPGTGIVGGTPTTSGDYSVTVEAADGTAPSSQDADQQLTIHISDAPALAVTTAQLPTGQVGQYYSGTVQTTGGVGPFGTYTSGGTLPAGLQLDLQTGQITGTPTGAGDSTVEITVYDAAGTQVTQTYTITVGTRAAGTLTLGTAYPDATVGAYYTASTPVTGGSAPYGYTVTSGNLPSGLTFDAGTGALVGTPTEAGDYAVTVQVADRGQPTQQQTGTVTLHVDPDPGLQLSTVDPPAGQTGDPYSAGLGYSGGTGPYSWSLTAGSLPAGLALDPVSGMVTGTPTSAGTGTFTVQVVDSTGPTAQSATATLSLVVDDPATLAVGTTSLPGAARGEAYQATLRATGGAGALTWSAASGALPDGLTLSPDGTLSGAPTGSGSSSVTVAVRDSASPVQTAQATLSLAIDAGAPLTVTTSGLDDATQGSYYTTRLTVDGGAGSVGWTLTGGRLPDGLTLDPAGTISGTPTGYGSTQLTVQATDGSTPSAQTAVAVLDLTVVPIPLSAPTFTQDSPPDTIARGEGLGYNFAASGNPAPRITLSSGQLPPGLSIAPDGTVSGTATKAGTFTYTLTAANGRTPDAVSASHTLTVLPPPTISSVSPLKIAPGGKITIRGHNLGSVGNTYVYLSGSGAYAQVTADTGSRITATVSIYTYAGTGPVYVFTRGGTALSPTSLTVNATPPPTVTKLSPSRAPVGSYVTLTGKNLQLAQYVDFGNGRSYSFRSDTSTKLVVQVPSGATAGRLTVVTQNGVTTTTGSFTPTG